MVLLKNCRIIDSGRELIADILIEDGRIRKIGHNLQKGNNSAKGTNASYAETIDVMGNLVMPGIIDSHVHFREPGMEHKEDFESGSKAAAAGGITTFIDMPNTKPATTTAKLLEEKRKLAAKKSIVNYGFHFGASFDNLSELDKIANVASIKIFFNISTGKLLIEDFDVIERFFNRAAELGMIVSVHAEDEMLVKAINFAKRNKTRLYACHLSLRQEIDDVVKAKNSGISVYAEATPHHLFLSDIDDSDNFTKMKPSLKAEEDRQALWRAVYDNVIDVIATDHAPHTIGEKLSEKIAYGVPGVETMLPLLLDAAASRKISLEKIQQLCCYNPAKIFGIKGKGCLKPGYDADLVVVSLDSYFEVEDGKLFTKCSWSPFSERKLKGKVLMTFVNGKLVYDANAEDKFPGISKCYRGREVVFDGNGRKSQK